MEPTYETNPPAAELPAPVGGTVSSPEQAGGQYVASPEGQPSPGPAVSAPTTSHDPLAVPAPAPPVTAGAQPAPVTDDASMIADDADLIEKEWVIRAKSILAQTHIDPFLQNKEINKMKAEYIKKRYNKDVKVSEGS